MHVFKQEQVEHAARQLYHKGGFWLMTMPHKERIELVNVVIRALNDKPVPERGAGELADVK